MNSCDCFMGDIVRPKDFILTDFYILGLATGIGTIIRLVILSLSRLWGIAVYNVEKSKLASWALLVGIDLRLSKTSSEFSTIHKALTPVFLYKPRQYSLKCL